jgi:hypothetical protein
VAFDQIKAGHLPCIVLDDRVLHDAHPAECRLPALNQLQR